MCLGVIVHIPGNMTSSISHPCTHTQTVPEFTFETPNITVPEPDGPVETCILRNGFIDVNIVVTWETGPKSGAEDQATGNAIYTNFS